MWSLSILMATVACVWAYVPVDKEDLFQDLLLEQLADRMQKGSGLPALDIGNHNSLGSRSLEEEQYDHLDYDLEDAPLQPSIRDQEYLRHSTLWGTKYNDEDSEERSSQHNHSPARLVSETKTKNTLPAYCNPPNPCPVGFSAKDDCVEDFENTAMFSRRFQEEQDCMCDAEHMFDCPDNSDPFLDNSVDPLNDFEFNNFMRQRMQDEFENPFLTGERLPVAAKKGNRAL